MDPRKIFTRHDANPLLKPEDYPGIAALFNPSAAMTADGRTAMLVSILAYRDSARRDGKHIPRHTRVAWSDDGVHFTLDDRPLFDLEDADPDLFRGHHGQIDNRLTYIADAPDGEPGWYFIGPIGIFDQGFPGVFGGLWKTADFRSARFIDLVSLPENRGTSLFPEKIGGRYWRLDRPGAGDAPGSIWSACSPDLVHWGHYRPVLAPGFAPWAEKKIGPTPPIKTNDGWLTLIHGVTEVADGRHYFVGAMLLDLTDPTRVIGKTQTPLLLPTEPYELWGDVDNVVFPCGVLPKVDRDELWLYYGAADTRVCLAIGSLSATIDACRKSL